MSLHKHSTNFVTFSVVLAYLALFTERIACEVSQNEAGTEGVISLTPPNLNDEETHSSHMPDYLKCDACTAISFQFSEAFANAHRKRKNVRELAESEVFRLVEEVCGGEAMTKYGVKEVNKKKRLSGPGLSTEESAGIMQGGGKWPDRMNRMCNQYVETYDEEGVYQAWLNDRRGLKDFLCDSDEKLGLTDVCNPRKKNKRPRSASRDEL